MEDFDNYKEKRNQEEKIGFMGKLKFQRSLEKENEACQTIVSLFETEQAANKESFIVGRIH